MSTHSLMEHNTTFRGLQHPSMNELAPFKTNRILGSIKKAKYEISDSPLRLPSSAEKCQRRHNRGEQFAQFLA